VIPAGLFEPSFDVSALEGLLVSPEDILVLFGGALLFVLVGTIPDFGGVVVIFSGFLAVPNGVLVDLGADATIFLGAMLRDLECCHCRCV